MEWRETLSKMTLREKADLLTGKAFFKTRDYPAYGIRETYLSDGPHGLRKQASSQDHLGLHKSIPATCFPTASIMACSWDEALGERVGEALGREAASMGVDVLLGPGLNIKRNPLCGRNFEYFSEDPLLSGKMAASYVRGIQSENVGACVKHFAANNREYRRMTADSAVDERTLREIYLAGFEIALKEGGARAVMTSYNRLNGTYTNENSHLLRDILREEWGFGGVVVTDWAGSNDRVQGLLCGSDLEMPVCRYGADDLVAAVEEGRIPESLLDESILRLLQLIDFSADKRETPFDEEAHHALARECAEKSAVLLKNDGILPLVAGTKVAVIGDFAFRPRYQGAGSSIVNPTRLETAAEALKRTGLLVVAEERGFNRYGKKSRRLFRRAKKAAKRADVVLFFAGLDEFSEAEGIDRKDISFPANQKALCRALIAEGRRVVVVLACGSVVETDWADGAAAILYMGLSGQAGGSAAARLLTGEAVPAGKLAESWVENYEDCPTSPSSYFPGGKDVTEYREGLFVGYRYYITAGVKPKFPFGFGLSYTKFAYSDLSVSRDGVSFTLKNCGDREGDEIAQVYLSLPHSAVYRPERELKGFCRIHLSAGEEKRVFVPFGGHAFSFYDEERGWTREAGDYLVRVGASSEDIRLSATVTIDGERVEENRSRFPAYAAGKVKEVKDGEFYALLGYIPEEEKAEKRITVHENTTVDELRRARGFCGRAFSFFIRAAISLSRAFGNRGAANTMEMGVLHQPVRGLAKFGGMTRRKMEGLIDLFNGKFFRGLKELMRKEKKRKEKK